MVDTLAAVHIDAVTRTIAAQWGFARTGRSIADQILGTISMLRPELRPVRQGDHLWRQGANPQQWRGFRYVDATDPRRLDEVPPEEIANVAAWVLRRALSIAQGELVRESARELGCKSLTGKTISTIEAALPLLLQRGPSILRDQRWTVDESSGNS